MKEKEIIALVDYKGVFGSKYDAIPYRSGLDHNILISEFRKYEINIKFIHFSEIDFTEDWKNRIVIYTSSEDIGYKYKSFIEDIVFGLELKGAIVIPKYIHLRANNNKVFMEILRASLLNEECGNKSKMYGTLEEAKNVLSRGEITFPCVIKTAEGACSTGVSKANDTEELESKIKLMCKVTNFETDYKDIIRLYKHKGYIKESLYRSKFIIQPMIEGLNNDWKLLIFGNRIFNLKRHVRKNDFRASGSHNDYKYGSNSGLTSEMMDFAYKIYLKLNIPMLSFDLAYDGKKCYMIEFQSVYFGSSTFILCDDYYELNDGKWNIRPKEGTYEELYAWSINEYLLKNNLK